MKQQFESATSAVLAIVGYLLFVAAVAVAFRHSVLIGTVTTWIVVSLIRLGIRVHERASMAPPFVWPASKADQ